MFGFLKSRKTRWALALMAVPILNKYLAIGLTAEMVAMIVIPGVAKILGVAIEDAGEKAAGNQPGEKKKTGTKRRMSLN